MDLFGQKLTFERPDVETFECLKMAYWAVREGGLMPLVLNTANEVAVSLFLQGKIRFTGIQDIIRRSLSECKNILHVTLDDVLYADKELRNKLNSEYIN